MTQCDVSFKLKKQKELPKLRSYNHGPYSSDDLEPGTEYDSSFLSFVEWTQFITKPSLEMMAIPLYETEHLNKGTARLATVSRTGPAV